MSSDSNSGGANSSTLSPFARSFGIARKNSFASLSSVAGSGKGIVPNGYKRAPSALRVAGFEAFDFGRLAPLLPLPLFVLVVFVDMDVLQYAECVLRQNYDGAIERDEIRRDRFMVDAHEANRQAWRHFAR